MRPSYVLAMDKPGREGWTWSSLTRVQQILRVFAKHGFGSLVEQIAFDRSGSSSLGLTYRHDAAVWGRRFVQVLAELGPTYVKLGQALSTRTDVLPETFTEPLATLRSQVPTVPFQAVLDQIEGGLGAPALRRFASIDPTPLAAASIAQVHRATTPDGDDVVIKVHRPGIATQIDQDLELLRLLADQVERRIEEASRFEPRALVDRFGEELMAELDVAREAAAAKRFRSVVADHAHVPEIIDALTGPGVITMRYLPGTPITHVEEPAERRRLARALLSSFVHQMLVGGIFHADAHPGNVVCAEDGRLGYYDLGSVGEVPEDLRDRIFEVLSAATRRDVEALAEAVLGMVEARADVDRKAFGRDVAELVDEVRRRPLGEIAMADAIERVLSIVRTHDLRVRPQDLQLIRGLATLDGVLRELDPDLEPLSAALPDLVRATVRARSWGPAWALVRSLVRGWWARWFGRRQLAG
ncbi:MAG: AarF/UbiB family protein [Myxococcota bacterium]